MTEEGTKKVVYLLIAIAILILAILLIYKLPALDKAFRDLFKLEGPASFIENKIGILYQFYEDYKTCKLSPTDNCICDINLETIPNHVIRLTNNGIGKTEFIMVEGSVDIISDKPTSKEPTGGFRTGSKTLDSNQKESFTNPYVENDNLYFVKTTESGFFQFGTYQEIEEAEKKQTITFNNAFPLSEIYITKENREIYAYLKQENKQEIKPPYFIYKEGHKMEFFTYNDATPLSNIKKCEMPTKLRPPLLEFDKLISMIKSCTPTINVQNMFSQEIRVFLPGKLESEELIYDIGDEKAINLKCTLDSLGKSSWSIVKNYRIRESDVIGQLGSSFILEESSTNYPNPLERKTCNEGYAYLQKSDYYPIILKGHEPIIYKNGLLSPMYDMELPKSTIPIQKVLELETKISKGEKLNLEDSNYFYKEQTKRYIVGIYYSLESGRGSWNSFPKKYKTELDQSNNILILYQDLMPEYQGEKIGMIEKSIILNQDQEAQLNNLIQKLNQMSFTDALTYLKTIEIEEKNTFPKLILGNPYLPFDIVQETISQAQTKTTEKPTYCNEYKPISFPDYSIKYSANTFMLYEKDQLKKSELISINLCQQTSLNDKETIPPFEDQLIYLPAFTVEEKVSIQLISYPKNYVCLYALTSDQLKEIDIKHREKQAENIVKNIVL